MKINIIITFNIILTYLNLANSLHFDLSEDELSYDINFIDTHGLLIFSIPDNLSINKIKWSDLLSVQLTDGFIFKSIILNPLGDCKLGFSLQCKNMLSLNPNYIGNKSFELTFPQDYNFPEWLKTTRSRVDRLIRYKTIDLDLSNDGFIQKFDIIPYKYFPAIDVSTLNPDTVISNIYWSDPNDCNIISYFTKHITLTQLDDHTLKVFAQYFDEDSVAQPCRITIPNILVKDWIQRVNQIHAQITTKYTYNINVDLDSDDFLDDFHINPLPNEIYIFFKEYSLYNKLYGSFKWGNFFTKIFDGSEIISSIDLISIGDFKIKIYFLHNYGISDVNHSYVIEFPRDYEFPKWLRESAPSFLETVTSSLVYFELTNDHLPNEIELLEGFNTIELKIKKQFINKIIIRLITWDVQMFFHLDNFSVIIKIILTALGDGKLGIGIIYRHKSDDRILRKLSTVKVNKSKIPKWISDKTEFTNSLLKSETRLSVNLASDELPNELEIDIKNRRLSIKVALDYLDSTTIDSVYFNNDLLFKSKDRHTILKINIDIIDNTSKIQILYYDNNKLMQRDFYIELHIIPKWISNELIKMKPLP